MKVLIIGSGGREHALAWQAAKSPRVEKVYVAPGNAGTAREPGVENVAIPVSDLDGLLGFAREQGIELTITGPEDPLVNGIVDRFSEAGLACFGPSAAAAQLEGSKSFAKDFMARHGIPTAAYGKFTEVAPAIDFIRQQGAPIVVKADGLAAGKGVLIIDDAPTAIEAVQRSHDGVSERMLVALRDVPAALLANVAVALLAGAEVGSNTAFYPISFTFKQIDFLPVLFKLVTFS